MAVNPHDTEQEGAPHRDDDATGRVSTGPRPSTAAGTPLATAPLAAEEGWALRFLSGPRAGALLPLHAGREFVFGRGREADVVLNEDLVSRRHAVLSLAAETPTISDLGSTNGTFVNGERVTRSMLLRSGDRLLVGTSIARFILLDEQTRVGAPAPAVLEREKRPHGGSTMAGRLEEVPLVDLLQLFSTSRKTGELVVRAASEGDGVVVLSTGRLAAARLEQSPSVGHRKALGRLLRITEGAFEFVPADKSAREPVVPAELQEPTELLLMDALRLTDELRVLEPGLPPPGAKLVIARPLPGRLRALEPQALDLFQLALEHGTFGAVIDRSSLDDVEAVRGLLRLASLGYVTVAA